MSTRLKSNTGQVVIDNVSDSTLTNVHKPILTYENYREKGFTLWRKYANSKLWEILFLNEIEKKCSLSPVLKRRIERNDYTEEWVYFRSMESVWVPACILIPKRAKKKKMPAVVVLHDHGGFYLWGKEKVVEVEDEHPFLTVLKDFLYDGKSIASELARAGYVTIAIDAVLFGERIARVKGWPRQIPALTKNGILEARRDLSKRHDLDSKVNYYYENQDAYWKQMYQEESLIAKSMFWAGTSLAARIAWDDIKTVDYLLTRPEVDSERIGCLGLSLGGWRAILLAALDERIKVCCSSGWMCELGVDIMKLSKGHSWAMVIPGLYNYLDYPDLAGLIAPRPLMSLHGNKDTSAPLASVRRAQEKIKKIYRESGVPERFWGRIYTASHCLNLKMQRDVLSWFDRWLK